MSESKASRTLVKSPPELWSEVSSATSLQRHMAQFGEIRITKLEPETAVAWEGEHARGTIRLEASGWGTKVSLTAEAVEAGNEDGVEPDAAAHAEPEPGNRLEAEVGNRAEPEVASGLEAEVGNRAEPEVAGGVEGEVGNRAEAEVASGVESEVGNRVVAEAANDPGLDPPSRTTEDPVRGVTVALERDRREAEKRERRWTRRLARTLRAWFGAPPREHADPVAHAPGDAFEQPATSPATSEPERPATPPAPVASEPKRPATPPAPVTSEPERPATPPASATSEPERPTTPPAASEPERPTRYPGAAAELVAQQEAPAQPEPASTAALDAALDSLGQAHHRPFSRG